MKLFSTTNTEEGEQPYAIHAATHTMIWASANIKRHMFTKTQCQIQSLVSLLLAQCLWLGMINSR